MPSNRIPSLVRGEVILSPELASFDRATVYTYLEDVSYQDAPATILARHAIAEITHSIGTENRVNFTLLTQEIDPRANYSVRVHVSLQSDRQIQAGDYISTQTYPVLTHGFGDWVSIKVIRVNSY